MTLLSHVRQYRLGDAQYAEYVGIENRCGLIDCCFFHRADQVHSRIVDQYVDTTRLFDNKFDSTLDRGLVSNIHLDKFNAGYAAGVSPLKIRFGRSSLYSRRQCSITTFACGRLVNQFSSKHSSRNRPLNDSM